MSLWGDLPQIAQTKDRPWFVLVVVSLFSERDVRECSSGQRQHFLVSYSSGYMYLYNEELQCPLAPPVYQTFKQVTH